jgi:hypothetical protein
MEKLREIDFELPISDLVFFDGNFYVTGVNSWKVSRDFQQFEAI